MGSKIECFMIEPSKIAEESYRRFVVRPIDNQNCPLTGTTFHSTSAVIGRVTWDLKNYGIGLVPDDALKKDPRWPSCCECGYVYREDDYWQQNYNIMYRRVDSRSEDLWILANVPVGAMWNADWMTEKWNGPDGRCLIVKTPGGDWIIDGPSNNGAGWQRRGTPPLISVTPSILMPKYHGWLTDGFLVEC